MSTSISARADSGDPFSVVPWPFEPSTFAREFDNAPLRETLTDLWYENRMSLRLKQSLNLVDSQGWSIDDYVEWITVHQPALIEGERFFVTSMIPKAPGYIPILYTASPNEPEQSNAELVLRERAPLDHQRLGVLSPYLEDGGSAQIRHWIQARGTEPDIIALGSASEVIRHLLVGSIAAAALPSGALQRSLESMQRQDLLDQFRIETVPTESQQLVVYLREDLYTQLLTRTLVQETWLRDTLPQHWMLYSQQDVTTVP